MTSRTTRPHVVTPQLLRHVDDFEINHRERIPNLGGAMTGLTCSPITLWTDPMAATQMNYRFQCRMCNRCFQSRDGCHAYCYVLRNIHTDLHLAMGCGVCVNTYALQHLWQNTPSCSAGDPDFVGRETLQADILESLFRAQDAAIRLIIAARQQ